MYKHNFIYLIFFINGHLDYFHHLAIMSNVAMTMCAPVFVLLPVFNPLGYILRSTYIGHMKILCLTFQGTTELFPREVKSFYTPNRNGCRL